MLLSALTGLTETKRCTVCRDILPLASFNRNKRQPDGHDYRCRECDSQRKKERYATSEGKLQRRSSDLNRLYGIGVDEWEMMHVHQNGACFVCQKVVKHTLHTDHHHKLGHVRALLCTHCNTALGFFKDDATLARRLADYVERFATHGLLDELKGTVE